MRCLKLNEIRQLKDEVKILKKELHGQLEARKRELHELQRLQNSYEQLEKEYFALRNSFVGKTMIKYWKIRTRLKRLLKKG